MGRGSFYVGSIAGVRIALHPSWLVIAFLVTYSLAVNSLPSQFAGWEPIVYWLVAGTIASLFFLSVLAHELSHALVARRFGITVRDITLFIFGGAASLEGDAATPRAEALIAAAGPLTSLVLGGALLGIDAIVSQPQLNAVVGWLGFINVTLGHLQPHSRLPHGWRSDPARPRLEAAGRPVRGDARRGHRGSHLRVWTDRIRRLPRLPARRPVQRHLAGADRLVPFDRCRVGGDPGDARALAARGEGA